MKSEGRQHDTTGSASRLAAAEVILSSPVMTLLLTGLDQPCLDFFQLIETITPFTRLKKNGSSTPAKQNEANNTSQTFFFFVSLFLFRFSSSIHQPDGGVKSGERFDAIIVQQAGGMGGGGMGGSHAIPTGHWRDGLCDCCTLGCCHAVCCLGFWFRMCLLGQVLSRNKLSWMGSPNGTGRVDPCSYQFWFAMMVVSLVVGFVSNIIYSTVGEFDSSTNYDEYGNSSTASFEWEGPAWAEALVSACSIITTVLGILACVATCRARGYMREKYHIEPSACGGCDDCCCAYWCGPCAICQMARHTADYSHFGAECCSATGLSASAPEVV
jgi:Cys-rich protein (TIGR01571 family)